VLASVVTDEVFAYLLVFVRVGTAIMLLPGFGEAFIPQRVRLALAVALAVAIGPAVVSGLPAAPSGAVALMLMLGGEMAVGLLIGATARFTLSALQVAGTVIAFQANLAYAQTIDPSQSGVQSALVSALLSMLALVLIFVTDLHHVLLRAVHDS